MRITSKKAKKIKRTILEWDNLNEFVSDKSKFYKSFPILTKKKKRWISQPINGLKKIHTDILDVVSDFEMPKYVHGFVRGRSVSTNAENHVDSRIVSSYDIKDFFQNTCEKKLINGLSKIIKDQKILKLIINIAMYRGGLPQGAPLSSILANLSFLDADRKLNKLAQNNSGIYSRYADDFTISSSDRGIYDMVRYIEGIVEDSGYRLNSKKTRHQSMAEAQIVTGLVVNKKVQPTKKYRYNLKAKVYNIMKSNDPLNRADFRALEGECNWVKMFNENFFNRHLKPGLNIINNFSH